MPLYKNVSGQITAIYAYDTDNGVPLSDASGTITAYISKDGGSPTQTDTVNPNELGSGTMRGIYTFSLTQAETNCNLFSLSAQSTVSGIDIEPVIIYTE